jgi:pimeloyl-ACP methyl ester carboxylesterase
MPTVEVDGHELYYEVRGTGEPLLAIMGMSGTHRTWGEPFIDALAEDFAVLTYDNRGVGRSSRIDEGFTIAELAADARALLDAVGWSSAHVVGISMGGMVAQELALRWPGRVRTLTLGCTSAGGPQAALAPAETMARLAEAWQTRDRETVVRATWETNVCAAFAADDEAWQRFRAIALELPVPMAIIALQVQAIAAHDALARLHWLSMPTLIVHGTDDRMLPVSNAHAMAAQLPTARVELWDGVGHLFFWERPRESAALVREHALAAVSSD